MAPNGFVKVGNLSALKPGHMLAADVNGCRVLVVNVNNEIFAVSEECPHAGAPLADGYLTEDLVECPFHASVFNIRTGRHVDGPASDNLATYEVLVEDDNVYVGPEVR